MNESAAVSEVQLPPQPASKPRFRWSGPQVLPQCRSAAAARCFEEQDSEERGQPRAVWLIGPDFQAAQLAAELNSGQAARSAPAAVAAQEAAPWRRSIEKPAHRPLPEKRSDS